MKAYVYHTPSNYIFAIIQGNGNADIVKEFEQQNWEEDSFGLSFTDFGLVAIGDILVINTPEYKL